MIHHKRNNIILNLKYRDGSTAHTHEDISTELNNFYSRLLKEPRVDRSHAIREITKNIPSILNQNHSKMILREVSMQEVEEVVMSMPIGKAP